MDIGQQGNPIILGLFFLQKKNCCLTSIFKAYLGKQNFNDYVNWKMSKVSKCRGKSGGFFSGKEYEKESCTKRQLSRKKEIFWVNRNIVDLSQESFFESCFSDWKSTFLWVSLKTSSVFKVSLKYLQHFIKKIVALNYSGFLSKVEWARTEGPRE